MSKSTNFNVIQGDSFSITVTYTNDDGTPFVLDGYSIIFSVRNEQGGKVLCATCEIGDGIEIIDSDAGIFKITVSATKTKNFTLPKAHYQCQIYTNDNNKSTIIQGWFAVEKSTI